MRCPDPTPEQAARDAHTFARASGLPCLAGCPHCLPIPKNRSQRRALVNALVRQRSAS